MTEGNIESSPAFGLLKRGDDVHLERAERRRREELHREVRWVRVELGMVREVLKVQSGSEEDGGHVAAVRDASDLGRFA